MRPSRIHSYLYSTTTWIQRIALTAIFPVLLQIYAPEIRIAWIQDARAFLQENRSALGSALAAVVTMCAVVRTKIGEPWLWQCVTDILCEFQKDVFESVGTGEIMDDHRVTLYQRKKWCCWPRNHGSRWWPWGRGNWPWSGWMVPVVRAGPESRATTVFLAKNGNDSEGVCGAAFFSTAPTLEIKASELPNIREDSTDTEIEEYARKTFVSADSIRMRIRRKRPCARCYLARRVEVEYKRWGVLMIDSRADKLPQPQKTEHRFAQINDVLGHLLRRS